MKRGTRLRLVIDTNVYVSALLKETGKPASVVEYAARGTKIIASPETWNEFVEVIGRPKFKPYVSRERVAAFSGLVYRKTTMVSPQKEALPLPRSKGQQIHRRGGGGKGGCHRLRRPAASTIPGPGYGHTGGVGAICKSPSCTRHASKTGSKY